MQPLVINLTGKKIIIAGGGRIACRKAKVLENEQATITFVAPEFCEEALALSTLHGYTLIKREAEVSDFKDAFLVILATNNREINHRLFQSISPQQLVCVVDEAEEGNVTFPATVRRGHLQIAITSNGASPKLTRKLKKELEMQFDKSWVLYTEFLANCRSLIKLLPLSYEEKEGYLLEVLEKKYRVNNQLHEAKLSELRKLTSH